MVAIARLDPAFKNYELGIDVEPLCEANEPVNGEKLSILCAF